VLGVYVKLTVILQKAICNKLLFLYNFKTINFNVVVKDYKFHNELWNIERRRK